MKELSVEEKAKAYDKIVDRAKKELNACGSQNCDAARQIFRLFPELKESESEDERIRKALVELVHDTTGDSLWVDYNVHKEDALAWLEKQGEQKQELLTKEKALKNSPFVEQKPTELPKGEDYGIDGLYAAIDILQKTLGEVDGYQSDDGILEHKCAISAVKELSKQKPAWSEEDETGLTNTIIMLKEGASLHFNKKDITKAVDWLRTFKDRVQPLPKQD